MSAVPPQPQARGPEDTGSPVGTEHEHLPPFSVSSALQPTRRDKRRWQLVLLLSAFAHLFLTPWSALLGWVQLLGPREQVDEPPIDAIPIELLEAGELLPEPEPEPPAPEPSFVPEEEPLTQKPEAPQPPPEKKPDPPQEKEKTGGALADPVSLAGSAGEAVDSNANVRVLLNTSLIREHELGQRLGRLLRRTPQWSDFFGPAGLDPIRDLDHLLIAGPQFRDSSNVVAVVQHRLPEERVQEAFDRLVARGGEWIEQDSRLMARARADRADRIFVAPAPHIVAVVPASAEKSARALGKNLRFPSKKTSIALQAYVITPWRVTRGTGIQFPTSIQWARLQLQPDEQGGARLLIEAEDESESAAKENAQFLEAMILAASQLDLGSKGGLLGGLASFALGGKKQKFIESVELKGRGNKIEGQLVLTRNQLLTLLDLIDFVLPVEAEPPQPSRPPQEKSPRQYGDNPYGFPQTNAPKEAP